jgi:hypothetical protein
LLVLALPGFAQTGIVGTIVRAGGFLAQWPTEATPAATRARLEAQQHAFGGLDASLVVITVPASETGPATIYDLTPWAVPGGAPANPGT